MSELNIGRRFIMRQRLVSIGDDYFVENDQGDRVCEIDGKMLRVRDTLFVKDMQGKERYKIQQKLLRVRSTMAISRGGDRVATVHKALVSPVRDRFSIDVAGGKDMSAKGNILDHEYTIERGGEVVAEVSKKWFRLRDSYGIDVKTDEDPFLVLAVAVCIDAMAHDGKSNK